MRVTKWVLALVAVMTLEANAYQPAGWVWFAWPYAYDMRQGSWWYFQGNTYWSYGFLPADGWKSLGQSGLAQGWAWYAWPYACDFQTGAWYYMAESDNQWCFNLAPQQWGKFGELLDLMWTPGRSVGPVCLGDRYASIRVRLGTPSEIRRTDPGGESTMWSDYDDLGISLSYPDINDNGQLDDNEAADGIFANSGLASPPRWNYRGLTFGVTPAAATAVLGSGTGTGSIWWFDKGVMLRFSDGGTKLSTIYVFPTH